MPALPLSELRDRVGDRRQSVTDLHVEHGKVVEYARATGADAPVYTDPSVARDSGHPAVPAPPTFTRVWQFPRYQPDRLTGYRGFDLGFETANTVHAEQEYVFERPVYVGDTLDGETTLSDVFQQSGSRGGEMTFAVYETRYRDAADELVLTERTTLVETEGNADDGGDDSAGDDAPDAAESAVPDADLVETLDRVDFVRYAGASGDFTRYHIDEPWTRAQGYDTVFGQGMLTCALAARPLTTQFGAGALDRVQTRFAGFVRPGDSLAVTCESAAEPAEESRGVDLSVVNQRGETVLTGTADVTPGAVGTPADVPAGVSQ